MPTMLHNFLADMVLIIHFGWIVFLILGFPVILYMNIFWLRLIHAGGLIAALIMQITRTYCPLTLWEERLTHNGVSPLPPRPFLLRIIEDFIYIDAHNMWIISIITAVFIGGVALSFWLRPPQKKRG
jgi:hypothetical protein